MPRQSTIRGQQRTLITYAFVVTGVIIASLGGYVGYVLYPRFDLPAVTVAGLFLLAAGAGIASFFSPCSFPLLISLFGRSPSQERKGSRPSWRQTVPFALGLSFGATVFLILVGLVIAVAGTQVFAGVVFTSAEGIILRSIVGVVLVALGLIQLGAFPVRIPPVQDLAEPLVEPVRSRRAQAGIGRISLFGFGYLVAGFG